MPWNKKRKTNSTNGKRKRKRTIAAVAASGLNSKEKKQVMNICKGQQESKYYKTSAFSGQQGFQLQTNVVDGSVMEVIGLAVGKHEMEQVAGTYGYSSSSGPAYTNLSLNMFRTFQAPTIDTDTDPVTIAGGDDQKFQCMIPEGRKTTPAYNRTTLRIFRTSVNTNSDDKAKMANPYLYRLVRVKPRKNKFTDVEFDPQLDLFVDDFNEAYGIYSGGNEYRTSFNQFQLMTAKLNTRRYEVLNDTQFTLYAPTVTTNGWEGSGTFNGRAVTDVGKPSAKIISFSHKTPKMLHYDGKYQDVESCQPLSGNSEELIFIHATMIGDDEPNINLQHKLDIKCVSTFKDC